MIINILSNIISQLIYFIGIIFAVGYLISIFNRVFYKIFNYSRVAVYSTGFIGTPIHELGHALLCLVFFHKIDEIKLFQTDDENGVLGYVNHSYNPRNLYQKTGNYFIGIAPIVCGSLVLTLAMKWFLPYAHAEMNEYLDAFAVLQEDGISFSSFAYAFAVFSGVFSAILAELAVAPIGWIFLVIALCIALHMNLSGADIKGALGALPLLCGILVIVNLVLGLILPGVYEGFTFVMNRAGAYLSGMLLLSLVFSVVCVAVALLIYAIKLLVGAIRNK